MEKCGCTIKYNTSGPLIGQGEIVFCSLHAAAGEMVEALVRALKIEHRENSPYHSVWYEDCDLCTLIAKAETNERLRS